MSDDKPFEATPHRIQQARREGNVARAGELSANIAFAAACAVALASVPKIAAMSSRAIVVAASGNVPWGCVAGIAGCALAALGAAATAGSLAILLQAGAAFVPVTPKFERIDPAAGLKRMFSGETLAHAARSSLAFALAAGAMLPVLALAFSQMVRAAEVAAVAQAAWNAAQHTAFTACGIGVLFALAEFGAARQAWLRKLRMSFDERKREAKEQEGDPFARGRRRSLHRSLLRGSLTAVERASFVVANPTHVAVALEYRPPEVPVPIVLVRAIDAVALQVRARAAELGIAVIEDVALARALHRDGRSGEPIPHEHYVAVAAIVAALLRPHAVAP